MPNETPSQITSPIATARRHVVLILLSVVVAGAVALIFSLLQTPQYSAAASLLFRDQDFDDRFFGSGSFRTVDPAREAATNIRLVSLGVVADRTASALDNGLTADEVFDRVEIAEEGQSDVVSIVATDPDPEDAAGLANAFAETYVDFRRQADRDQIRDAQRLIEADYERLSPSERDGTTGSDLQKQLSDLRTLEALQTGNAEVVEPADTPTNPSSPNTVRNIGVALVLGAFIGIGAALLRERLDNRLHSERELETVFGLPVLASVPKDPRLATARFDAGGDSAFPILESFRMLRARLRYFNLDRKIESLVVSSALPSEGKSTVALNLAISSAHAGLRTVLVEGDFHEPVLAVERGLSPLPGLSEFLTDQASLDTVVQTVSFSAGERNFDEGTLDFITAGAMPPNPAQMLESQEMRRLIGTLEETYELVIIDSPPISVVSDAIPLLGSVSGLIIICRLDVATQADAVHLRDTLTRLDAPTLGMVVNMSKGFHPYGYGYTYGSQAESSKVISITHARAKSVQ